jgi:hypothetical protein
LPTGETVFESYRFRIERRPFDHGGRRHVHDVIVHPGAAVILPVLDDGRLVLIANYRVAVDEELLELPAGTLDAGEPPGRAAGAPGDVLLDAGNHERAHVRLRGDQTCTR